jgi:putative membrane protein
MANSQDLQFLEQAGTSGVTEIDLSNLAISSSPTFAVIQFAQQDVVDHTSLNAQLASIVQAEKLPMPSAFSSSAVQSSIATQVNVSAPNSDEEYLSDVINAHQQDVADYQREIAAGQDPQLRSFAKARCRR